MDTNEVVVAYTIDVLAYVDLDTKTVTRVVELSDDIAKKGEAYTPAYNVVTDEEIKKAAYAVAEHANWPVWEKI